MPVDENGNPIVNPDDKGGQPDPKATPPSGDGKDTKWGDDKDKDKDMIPSYRLKEEADKRREAESKLAEYQKKEAKEAEDKKKSDEAEALKKWEHEKVIKEKETEIESYKEKEKSREEKNAKIKTMADNKLADFEKKYGKEALDNAKTIIGSEDPRVILDRIDAVEKIVWDKKPPVGWSQDQKWSGWDDNQWIKFYQDKMDKWEKLSAVEEQEYFALLYKMD